MILKTTKQWRILLILSCCVGIIAPTLIITAFAMFDTSIIIVKISALQNYNLHVRRWTENYRLDFLDYRFFLFANESGLISTGTTVPVVTPTPTTVPIVTTETPATVLPPTILKTLLSQNSEHDDDDENNSNSNSNSKGLITPHSVGQQTSSSSSSSSIEEEISDRIPFQKYIEFTSSINSESITFPTSEMIKMYQPLVYIVNLADLTSKEPFTLQPNENFTSNPIQLYLYEKNTNISPEIQFITNLKFDLFKKPGQVISKYSKQLNANTSSALENDSDVYENYHIFDNACFVFKDKRIILEPCVYGGSLFNYTLVETNGTNPISFSLANRVIRIKYYQDPYLLAGNLTSGSYSFAMNYNMQKKLGIAFLILGLVLSILFLIQLWILVKMKKFNVPEKINSNQGDSAMSSSCSTLSNNGGGGSIQNNMIIGNNEPYDPNSIEMDIYNHQYHPHHQQQHSFINNNNSTNNNNNNNINGFQHQQQSQQQHQNNLHQQPQQQQQQHNRNSIGYLNENNSVYYRNSDSINTFESDEGIMVEITNPHHNLSDNDDGSDDLFTRSISVDFNDNNSNISNHSTPIIGRTNHRNSENFSNRRHSFANTRSLSTHSESSSIL